MIAKNATLNNSDIFNILFFVLSNINESTKKAMASIDCNFITD